MGLGFVKNTFSNYILCSDDFLSGYTNIFPFLISLQDRTKSPIKEIPFEVGEHGPFVELGKFVEYLKENSCENDTSGIRKPNIRRQISRFKDKIRTDEEIEQVPIASVVRYMFQHMDEFNVCKKVCQQSF